MCSPTPSSTSSRSARTRWPARARLRSIRASRATAAAGLPPSCRTRRRCASGADVVFVCLEHERAAELDPPARGVVIDLSGAHRLREPAAYAEWYGFDHARPDELGDWSYALPELLPPAGRLVANPGCYATAALLALLPLARAIDAGGVVVDAKSGVSGAGRSLQASSHAGFVLENVSAYKVGRHQHQPEIEQALGFPVCFVPHLLPVRRGLIATCYVRGVDADDARALLEFRVHRLGLRRRPARRRDARARRACRARTPPRWPSSATGPPGPTVVICAIDNLGKGAAGQAVQNANLALGFRETAGLRLHGVPV